ncbi:MAG: hypothetical protein DRJ64_02960 [Thermoprotei archaeon]|nr:MAG: hypothetical protein DRJ64_02960 [Thermoprotei archaeon]
MKWTKEIAFLIGALEDGSLIKRAKIGDFSVEIEQKDKKWLEKIAENFKKAFSITPTITYRKDKNVWRLRVYSKKIVEKLEHYQKNLEELLYQSLEIQKSFLQAVYDAEGSVDKNKWRITLSNKKIELLLLLKKMLKNFGIETQKIWHYKWGVKVLPITKKKNIILFYKLIGFSHSLKKRKLEKKIKSLASPP